MKRFAPWNTVRGRLLILAIGIEMLMLMVLVFNSLRLLHGAMTNQARSQAAQYHPVLKAALTAPLAQHDYATVQAVINESRTAGDVLYIVVVDQQANGRDPAGGRPTGLFRSPARIFRCSSLKRIRAMTWLSRFPCTISRWERFISD